MEVCIGERVSACGDVVGVRLRKRVSMYMCRCARPSVPPAMVVRCVWVKV